jgi:hypothetical protein
MENMTRRQVIAKMKKFGIEGEVTGAGKVWEVELKNEKTMKRFCAAVQALGGYKTGYDSWILRPGYEPSGDWNDKSSTCHY